MTFYIIGTSTNASTNSPIVTLNNPVEVQGLDPCLATAYDANRPSIPAEQTYGIGLDGSINLPYTFDITPSSCENNY